MKQSLIVNNLHFSITINVPKPAYVLAVWKDKRGQGMTPRFSAGQVFPQNGI